MENHYGYEDDDVDLIERWSGLVLNGIGTGFSQLMDFVDKSDLSIDENYQHLCRLIDLSAFID